MAVGLLGTAASGLQAFQRAISVAGNNIANANTEGYSRQRIELGTREPTFSGSGFVGAGVKVEGIERMFDQFVVERLRETTSSNIQYETLARFSARVSDLLGDTDAGLNAGLESFFNATQAVADDPSSIPARELLLTESDSLVTRFSNLNNQLNSLGNEVEGNMTSMVSEINSLSSAIANANRSVVDASGGAGSQPNDLLDRRDALITRLSELVSVRTVDDGDGSVNVFVGSGQPLVSRFLSSPLQIVGNQFDPGKPEIAVVTGGISTVITNNLTGGKLGAVLDFKNKVLEPAQNSLGRIAVTLATELNNQSKLGMDLNGNMGGDMFSVGSPLVGSNSGNTGSAAVAASFDVANIQDLTTNDYELNYNGSVWNLSRVGSGQSVPLTGTGPFFAEGLRFDITGTAQAGDRFEIQPTRSGANDISSLLSSAREIAAAAPVRISEQTNANGLPTNAGNGAFEMTGIDNTFTPLAAPLTFTYDAALQQFTDGTSVIPYNPATDSGKTLAVGTTGITVKFSGTPVNTDAFVLRANTAGSSDNGNALRLSGLQTNKTMEGGNSNFQSAYGQLIGKLGSQTRSAQITSAAQTSLLQQAQESRDSISGVNLDEEAANLLRFQQAYQAVAQVINTANTTFQTLLSAIGR